MITTQLENRLATTLIDNLLESTEGIPAGFRKYQIQEGLEEINRSVATNRLSGQALAQYQTLLFLNETEQLFISENFADVVYLQSSIRTGTDGLRTTIDTELDQLQKPPQESSEKTADESQKQTYLDELTTALVRAEVLTTPLTTDAREHTDLQLQLSETSLLAYRNNTISIDLDKPYVLSLHPDVSALFLGIPGQHSFYSLQAETSFSQKLEIPALAAGWADFMLARVDTVQGYKEPGFVKAKDQFRAWLACLAKIDLELNTGMWSEAQAQHYLELRSGIHSSEAKDLVTEVLQHPGHYAGLVLVSSKLRNLYTTYEGTTGFDPRMFNDQVLGGIAPMIVIEDRLKRRFQ